MKPLKAEFRFERDMAHIARQWMTEQELMTKAEFYTPWGVCDLVGISLEQSRVQQRLGLGQRLAVGPLLRVEILARVPDVEEGASISFKRLERLYRGSLPAGELRTHLDSLVNGNFLRINTRGAYQKVNGWAPLHKRIVALELKLRRVEEALGQALSHFAFAEESFVGLPARVAERVVNSNRARRFKSSGVGIISIGPDGCAVLLPSEPRTKANPVFQMHCVERFWRTRAKGNSASTAGRYVQAALPSFLPAEAQGDSYPRHKPMTTAGIERAPAR